MSEVAVFEALKYRIEVNDNGTRLYYDKDNQPHRIDGPAIEFTNGTKYWCQNGKWHRTDGPAIEYPTGLKRWFIDGVEMTEAEFNQRVKLL